MMACMCLTLSIGSGWWCRFIISLIVSVIVIIAYGRLEVFNSGIEHGRVDARHPPDVRRRSSRTEVRLGVRSIKIHMDRVLICRCIRELLRI